MNRLKILEKLIEYGLSEPEAKIYCSTLALEEATVDKIARHAGLNRTSSYPIFERLKLMGLVSQGKKKKKTVFKAARPEKLVNILDEKREGITEILPDLKNLFDISRGRPGVSFFEGKEGLKTVLTDILNEAKEVYILGEGESFINAIPGWTEAYIKKRAGKNIKIKMILRATDYGLDSIRKIRESGSGLNNSLQVRMLPEAYRIDYSGFDIYNNKVVLYSFEKDNHAVVVESQVITRMMKTVFETLWNEAEKYNNLLK
jgi:HTH-type transcriptional regulator, sugar sensing transcriptional regulator